MSNSKPISISLCGDVLITRRLPNGGGENLKEIQSFLMKHDCCFANLETTIHRNEGYPEAFPGGGYAMGEPGCLSDLKNLGFNLFNTANNHSMDFSHKGLLATIKYLNDYEIPFAGTGENLSAASRATFLDVPNGRIAMLGVTSSFHDSYAAGAQNMDMQGRPGVAPLRHKAIYELSGENYDHLAKIASDIGINNYHNQAIKEGYLPEVQNLKFGSFEFKKGEIDGVHTTPNEADQRRSIAAIKDAKYRSDIVIVSVHSHQFAGKDKQAPPDFIKIFAHNCIDAGADIIVCHGPHILRGVEAYNNGIILHGLGNFIFQHEDVDVLPEEFYTKYGSSREMTSGVGEIMNIRSKNGTIGLATNSDVWESIMASIVCDDDYMKVELHPIDISNDKRGQRGLPKFSNRGSILKKIQSLSLSYNTNVDVSGNVGSIIIHKKK